MDELLLFYSSITVHTQLDFILVSGAQHHGWTIVGFTEWSPPPPVVRVPEHGHDNVTDCSPGAARHGGTAH